MRDIEKLITGASAAMKEKLEENNHKPGWGDLTLNDLMRYYERENIKLRQAVYFFKNCLVVREDRILALKEIRRESDDCMNFLAMIIEWCNKEIEEEDK